MCVDFLFFRELMYQGGGRGGVGHPPQYNHHLHHTGGGNRVSGPLINTAALESGGGYSSANNYSPSTKSLNMNNSSPQHSPVMYHSGYHHPHQHLPPREDISKDNLATEV